MKVRTDPVECLREFVAQFVVIESESMPEWPIVATTDVFLGFDFGERRRIFDHRHGAFEDSMPVSILGPQTQRWAVVHAAHRFSGLMVRFEPGGFHRLFDIDVSQITDHCYAGADVLGREALAVRQQIEEAATVRAKITVVERFLMTRVSGARNTQAMHHAGRRLKATHGSVQLDALVDAYGISHRQFRRLFATQLGMSPKHYAKVERFSYALRLKRQCPWLTWAQVSQEAGYFDQMHLVDDCKALGAATPTRLLPMVSAPVLPLSDEAASIPASIAAARSLATHSRAARSWPAKAVLDVERAVIA